MPAARAANDHTRKGSRDKRLNKVLSGVRPGPASPEAGGKRASPAVQVLDGGAAPENATGIVRRFRPTHVLIIDAADGGRAPGEVFFIDEKKIADDDLTTHRVPLSRLVRYLEEDIGCRVMLVGIQPGELSEDAPMSPAVKAAVGSLVSVIAEAIPM